MEFGRTHFHADDHGPFKAPEPAETLTRGRGNEPGARADDHVSDTGAVAASGPGSLRYLAGAFQPQGHQHASQPSWAASSAGLAPFLSPIDSCPCALIGLHLPFSSPLSLTFQQSWPASRCPVLASSQAHKATNPPVRSVSASLAFRRSGATASCCQPRRKPGQPCLMALPCCSCHRGHLKRRCGRPWPWSHILPLKLSELSPQLCSTISDETSRSLLQADEDGQLQEASEPSP